MSTWSGYPHEKGHIGRYWSSGRSYVCVENDDFCFRIRKAGWKIRYLSIAEVVYHDSASLKRSPRFYHHYQIAWHGLWHYFKKHRSSAHAWTFRMISLICSIVDLTVFIAGGFLHLFNKNRAGLFREKGKKAWAVSLWSITPSGIFKVKY